MSKPTPPLDDFKLLLSENGWRKIIILEWLAALALASSALAILFKIYTLL